MSSQYEKEKNGYEGANPESKNQENYRNAIQIKKITEMPSELKKL